jgi:hypothetical protein
MAVFHRTLNKIANNPHVPYVNQLYYMRGMCQFKLRQWELAEKDFQ